MFAWWQTLTGFNWLKQQNVVGNEEQTWHLHTVDRTLNVTSCYVQVKLSTCLWRRRENRHCRVTMSTGRQCNRQFCYDFRKINRYQRTNYRPIRTQRNMLRTKLVLKPKSVNSFRWTSSNIFTSYVSELDQRLTNARLIQRKWKIVF